MLLYYAVFHNEKQLKVFPYDTSIVNDKARVLKNARRCISDNALFGFECTVEHFGLSGIGELIAD